MALQSALFVLAILGAIYDWRYKRRGGKRPSTSDRLLYLFALLLVAGFMVWLHVFGGESGDRILGQISVIALRLFYAWEFMRWRVRREYPLRTRPHD